MKAFIKMLLLLTCPYAIAETNESLEYTVKAAYLYNFTKFISWPKTASPAFNICVVGPDPFGNLLDVLESKTVEDKPIQLLHDEQAKALQNCQIIYLNEPITASQTTLLNTATLNHSLTVSSQPHFAELGGMIGFAIEAKKVKLHINLKALKYSGLNISAKLIEVAVLVGED